jgi:four helix bundle protein
MLEFNFEGLMVYQNALGFANEVFTVTGKFPFKFQNSLGDQMRRAALSIVNNIAEGCDQPTKSEKRRFYRYSLNSSRECVPMISISKLQRLIDEDLWGRWRKEALQIAMMMKGLVESVERNGVGGKA